MPIPVFAPEFLLLSHVQNLGKQIALQKALVFKLSRLDQASKQQLGKFAEIERAARTHLGSDIDCFLLSSFDFVIMGADVISTQLSELMSKILLVFGGDSFIATIDRSHYQNLCQPMDLSKEIHAFNSFVLANYNRRNEGQGRPSSDAPLDLMAEGGDNEKNVISLQNLSSFEQPLVSNDLSSITRRQDICLVDSSMRMRIVMSEIFVSILELTDGALSASSIQSNLWLFMHFTTILDKRVLAFLRSHEDSRFRSAISINLNVSSFFTPAFHNFDRSLNQANRETIMFELQLIDIVANLEQFHIARDALQERGYRFCIDSVPYTNLEFIDNDLFGLDMIKINASGKFRNLDRPTLVNTVRRIDELGSDKFILCRCDDKETIEFGQKMKIKLFQGHFIDKYRQALALKLAKDKRWNAAAGRKPPAHPRAVRPT